MGNQREIKLAVLSVLFFATCFFVYRSKEPVEIEKKPSITHHFKRIDGYRTVRNIKLEDNMFSMLDLDDYTFTEYIGKNGRIINLYIGYYYTANKASAAHSPLICYPSQGWGIDNRQVTMSLSVGSHKILYNEITASLEEKRELVLYWYQSHLDTNTHYTLNKIDIALNTLTKNDEQHAFVRVAVPYGDSTYGETKKTATDFIRVFYPQFLEFITGEKG